MKPTHPGILGCSTMNELRYFDLEPYLSGQRSVTPAEIAHFYGLAESFWQHSGNPAHHHVELAAGGHSNGYLNGRVALSNSRMLWMLANQLKDRIIPLIGRRIDVVTTASYGANDLGAMLAVMLNARHVYTQKEGKEQVLAGLAIAPDEFVVAVEELVTSGESARKMMAAIDAANPTPVQWAEIVPCLILRDLKTTHVSGREVVPLVEFDMWNAAPEECPLCAAGSVAIKPKEKGTNNWGTLIGEMRSAA